MVTTAAAAGPAHPWEYRTHTQAGWLMRMPWHPLRFAIVHCRVSSALAGPQWRSGGSGGLPPMVTARV